MCAASSACRSCAIAQLSDLLHYLQQQVGGEMAEHRDRVQAYRDRYGVA